MPTYPQDHTTTLVIHLSIHSRPHTPYLLIHSPSTYTNVLTLIVSTLYVSSMEPTPTQLKLLELLAEGPKTAKELDAERGTYRDRPLRDLKTHGLITKVNDK